MILKSWLNNKIKFVISALFLMMTISLQTPLETVAFENFNERIINKMQLLGDSFGFTPTSDWASVQIPTTGWIPMISWPNIAPPTIEDTCETIETRPGMEIFDCHYDEFENPIVTGPFERPGSNNPLPGIKCNNIENGPLGWECNDLPTGAMEFRLLITYHIELNETSVTVDRCKDDGETTLTATLIRTINDISTPVDNPNFDWSFTETTTNSTVTDGLVTIGQTESNSQLNLVVSEPRATNNPVTAVITTYTDLTIPTTAHTTFNDPQTCETWRVLVPNQNNNALIITEYVHGYGTIWFDETVGAYNWSGTNYHNTGTDFVNFVSSTLSTTMQNWYNNPTNVGSILRNHGSNYSLDITNNLTSPTTGDSRVFALTEQEVITHFGSNPRRTSIRQNAEIDRADVTTGWWIRTPSIHPSYPAQFVSYEILPLEIYNPEGIGFNTMQHEGVGFRPAIWITRP